MTTLSSSKAVEVCSAVSNQGAKIMKNNILSSLLVSSFIVTSGFTLSASAEDQDMSSSTVIVDDVTIEIRVNKSTIQTLQIPELTEDHMAGAFLPGV